MALNLTATNDCNHLSISTSYTNSAIVDINFKDANGASIGSAYQITIPSGGNSVTTSVPISTLSISNGIIHVNASISGTSIADRYILLHCDIDCCLTKLTNELIDCACDCERCSKTLAKAQKILLLVQSAEFALIQTDAISSSTSAGYVLDAYNKYNKALEICNETCGCNC